MRFFYTQRLSYRNSISIEKSVPEGKAFRIEGQKPIIFSGADTEVIIRESGEALYKGEVPPEVPPLSVPGAARAAYFSFFVLSLFAVVEEGVGQAR